MPKIFGIQIGKTTVLELAVEEAIALITESEYDAAIEVLEKKALPRCPDDRRAILHLGVAYMMKLEYDRAEELLTPLTWRKGMDSERAAAEIALQKIARERKQA